MTSQSNVPFVEKVTHAADRFTLMTVCGLPMQLGSNYMFVQQWELTDCPECLKHEEVRARVVEAVLENGPTCTHPPIHWEKMADQVFKCMLCSQVLQ